MTTRGHFPRARAQRGAALLLAMLIVTLVSTLAAGMVWQQWQAIEVEGAERARSQAGWLVQGATDWARLILRSDAQDSKHANIDSLDEVWATPLKDVKLSEFLAADRDNSTETGLEAFLSGQITDAQSRYNLRNLVSDEKEEHDRQLKVLLRLCEIVGVSAETATRLSDGMNGAERAEEQIDDAQRVSPGAPLAPQRLEQLSWLGLDAEVVRRLGPYVAILPGPTKVNLNTAPPEVLMAVIEGLDRATAERILRARLNGGLSKGEDVKKLLPERMPLDERLLGYQSTYFEILGELRYESFVLRERTLVTRRGLEVLVLSRQALPPQEAH